MTPASTFRYPFSTLAADYARAAAGLALTALPLSVLDVHPVVGWTLAAMAALFLAFLLRTAERQMTAVSFDGEGVSVAGWRRRSVAWRELSDLRLAFYSTRRDKAKGWMQLTVKGGGRALTVESTLDGFDELAEQAAGAAFRNGVAMSDATLGNLAALGITNPETGTPDEEPHAQAGAGGRGAASWGDWGRSR